MSDKYISRAGNFVCVVNGPGDGGWFSESKEKGTPFIRLPLTVIDEGDQKDKIIVWSGWLSDNAFDNTIKDLAKTFPEWDGSLEQLLPEGNFSFEGLQCRIVVESEDYNGETRFKVRWLNPLNGGGGGGTPLESAKLKNLVSKFGRKSIAVAKATRSESGTATAKAATPAPTSKPVDGNPPADDEIPY